jgi:hypothetical protein
MATRLDKTLKRELEVEGKLYTVTISPEGVKGRRLPAAVQPWRRQKNPLERASTPLNNARAMRRCSSVGRARHS